MKKFISIILSVLMLSAMAIPAMAEGEVTIKKLNYALNEGNFVDGSVYSSATVKPEVIVENGNSVLQISNLNTKKVNGFYIGNDKSENAVDDYVYETGFKIKLTNPGVANYMFNAQFLGNDIDTAIINSIQFKSYSAHNNDYRFLHGSNKVADKNSGFITGEWNDIRFLVEESATANTLDLVIYLNGKKVYERTDISVSGLNGTNKDKLNPHQWVFYYSNQYEAPIYLDDVYIASYTDVTTFVPETVNASVAVGEDAVLPSTVNVTVDGVQEAVEVEWADVDTTTAGVKTVTGVVKGYTMSDASDVTVTATVTVEAPQEPEYPYELAIDGTALTVTKAGTLTPEAKVYGAVYESGLLTDVQLLGTVSGSTAWTDGKATLPLENGKTYRAFVISDQLVPYAVSTELN